MGKFRADDRTSGSRPVRHNANIEVPSELEPDLQLLRGMVVVLRSLGETSDAVDPLALAALARFAGETLDRIERCLGVTAP